MIIEMNIEAANLDAAEDLVKTMLPGGQLAVKTRVAVVTYEGPTGPVTSGVLVVRAVLPDVFTAFGYAYYFAQQFEQDCIALYSPASQRGWLVGPNAVKWNPFDITYFKNF